MTPEQIDGTPASPSNVGTPPFGAGRWLFLTVLGLWGIGVAQPFFSLIGENPTFFVAHRSGPGHIVALTLLVYLAPPAAIFAAAWIVARLRPSLVSPLIPIGVGALAGLAVSATVWRGTDMTNPQALALWGGLSALGALLVWRYDPVRQLTRALGFISVVFPVLFLFASPVGDLLFGGPADAAEVQANTETPVALLVFDEFSLVAMMDPTGGIDRARLPNFARLADTSTWYRDTVAVSPQTLEAIPAIVTGRFDPDGSTPAPTAANYPVNLFTILDQTHQVDAWETVTRLCPPDTCTQVAGADFGLLVQDSRIVILNQLLPPWVVQRHLPTINDQWANFEQPRATRPRDVPAGESWDFPWDDLRQNHPAQFRELTARIGWIDGPVFWYEHVSLPHNPYIHRPDGSPNGVPDIAWLDNQVWPADEHERGVLMHAMQVEFVDRLLGEFLDSVEASGRFDELLLIVLADHGVGLRAGLPARDLAPATAAELLRVPMFVKYPGQRTGRIDDRRAETVDVFPTIADVLEFHGSIDVTGASLLEPPIEDRRRVHEPPAGQFDESVERFASIVPPGISAEVSFDIFMAGGS